MSTNEDLWEMRMCNNTLSREIGSEWKYDAYCKPSTWLNNSHDSEDAIFISHTIFTKSTSFIGQSAFTLQGS